MTIFQNPPAALEDALLKMLARDPALRYQTPLEVATALTPFCDDAPLAMPFVTATTTSTRSTDIPMAHLVEPTVIADEAFDGELGFGSSAVDPLPGEHVSTRLRAPVEGPPIWRRPLAVVAIGAAVLLSLSLAAFLIMRPKDVAIEPLRGSMVLSLDSPPNKTWAWLDRKPIIVKVARKDFTGPVTVAIENCPDWLDYHSATIAAGRNEGQLVVTIRVHAMEGPYTMKIVATADSSQPAFVEYAMEIVSARNLGGKNDPPGDNDKGVAKQ